MDAKGQQSHLLKSVNGVMQSQVTNRPVPKSLMRYVKWESLVAGISGGVVSTMILHPLDLVKIRFQVNEGSCGVAAIQRPKYHGMFHALRSIFHSGGLPGIYQGVTPNVWGTGASWGLYFFFYNSIKTWCQNGDSTVPLGFTGHMMASSEAGLLTLIMTNPIWVTKTRLCLQYEQPSLTQTKSVHYKGMSDALMKIYQMEGMRGLYKGFVPGVIGISHGMVQFTAYEELKNWHNLRQGKSVDTRLTTSEYLMFAALSKVLAASATYPYQVVRSRLQDQHSTYTGVVDVVSKMIKNEGVYGFYKGLVPNLVRVIPACCITFLVYENVYGHMTSSEKKKPDERNNGKQLVDDSDLEIDLELDN